MGVNFEIGGKISGGDDVNIELSDTYLFDGDEYWLNGRLPDIIGGGKEGWLFGS